MNEIVTFIELIFSSNHEISHGINIPVLVSVIVLLLIALSFCIMISKKNRLYIRGDKKQNKRKIIDENEVT